MVCCKLKIAIDILDKEMNFASDVKAFLDLEKEISIPDLDNLFDDPLFVVILIDESGSMQTFLQPVLDAQEEVLRILRATRKCRKDTLFVSQYLFNDKVERIHSFELLSENKKDSVIVLKENGNYNPDDITDICSAVKNMLEDFIGVYSYTVKNNIMCSLIIILITNGEDNINPTVPKEISKIMKELTLKNVISNSILVGVTDSKSEKENFEKLTNDLGFLTLLLFDGNIRDFRKGLS